MIILYTAPFHIGRNSLLMQCNKTSLAAETRTRAYYSSMCELQHPPGSRKGVSGLQPIRDLIGNEWSVLSIELFAEVNPLTLRETGYFNS